jgi:polar amino acid transport system permease protein
MTLDYSIETSLYLAEGAVLSLSVFAVTLVIAFPLSLLLAALYHFVPSSRWFIRGFTLLFRGTPLMLQLFFFMFGLPAFGIRLDRLTVAYVGFGINYAAYFIEIIRAGIEGIPKDQEESAKVLGASSQQIYWKILSPQALRIQVPVFTNELITLIKDTALVSVIALSDLLRKVREVVSRDFTISPFFMAAIFYLAVSFLIAEALKRVEKQFDFIG